MPRDLHAGLYHAFLVSFYDCELWSMIFRAESGHMRQLAWIRVYVPQYILANIYYLYNLRYNLYKHYIWLLFQNKNLLAVLKFVKTRDFIKFLNFVKRIFSNYGDVINYSLSQ